MKSRGTEGQVELDDVTGFNRVLFVGFYVGQLPLTDRMSLFY